MIDMLVARRKEIIAFIKDAENGREECRRKIEEIDLSIRTATGEADKLERAITVLDNDQVPFEEGTLLRSNEGTIPYGGDTMLGRSIPRYR